MTKLQTLKSDLFKVLSKDCSLHIAPEADQAITKLLLDYQEQSYMEGFDDGWERRWNYSEGRTERVAEQ